MNTFWNNFTAISQGSESDVITRLILPLLQALGWPSDEIHSSVPVLFLQGTSTGRKPEADIVLASNSPTPPVQGWVVVEAKAPGKSLSDALGQAHSYCYMLNAPFFVTCNGQQIEVWQKVPFGPNNKVFFSNIADLLSQRGELESILQRESVLAYCERNKIPTLTIQNVDVGQYLDLVSKSSAVFNAIPRTLKASGNDQMSISLGNDSAVQSKMSDGDRFFLTGWGGRGKSTILKLLISEQISGNDTRIPVFLDLRDRINASIFDKIAESFKKTVPALGTESAVNKWLQKVPSLIALDNWDALEDSEASRIEAEIRQLINFPCAIVITSRKNVQPPAGFLMFDVDRYTDGERTQVVEEFFERKNNQGATAASILFQKTPPALLPILNEPVILGKYLELLSFSPEGYLSVPNDICELMDKLLQEVLSSRYIRTLQKVDEVTSVCQKVSKITAASFSLDAIKQAIEFSGVSQRPSDFADEMVSSGLWERRGSSLYSFTHDIWRSHFYSKSMLSDSVGTLDERLMNWLDSANLGELLMMTPFFVSALSGGEHLGKFLDGLLRKDLSLYLSVLGIHANNTATSSDISDIKPEQILADLYRGYVEVIEIYFPALRNLFHPWSHGDGKEDKRGEKVVIVGSAMEGYISYHFGFGPKEGPNVIIENPENRNTKNLKYAPVGGYSRHTLNLRPNNLERAYNLHPRLGRFISSKAVLEELRNVVREKRLPPLGWTVLERFRTLVSCIRIQRNWELMTVEDIKKWCDVNSFHDPKELKFPEGVVPDGPIPVVINHISILQVGELASDLILRGFALVKLKDIGLPGPDLTPNKMYGGFSELYSDKQKIERVSILYREVMSTYKLYCETIFSKISHNFFFNKSPCRYWVEIDEKPKGWASGWAYWIEPINDWSEIEPKVSIGKSIGMERMDNLEKEFDKKSSSMGRKPMQGFRWGSRIGLWSPNDEAVTDVVSELLAEEIEKLQQKLNGYY